MQETRYIGEKDGELYMVSEETMYSEPILVRRYLKFLHWDATAAKFFREYGEEKRGQRLALCDRLTYTYCDEDGLRYELNEGGKTVPSHVEEEPYPCPKVRKGMETRYLNGRWEKLMKRGWVPA